MDSRDYICAFPIHSMDDVPADFEVPSGLSDLVTGVFLPQSDWDWLRRPAYPARLLLMSSDALWVIPHPETKAPNTRVPLSGLESIECGRILLLGWIGLHWVGDEQTYRYNRRFAYTLETFLTRLKASWLRRKAGVERPPVWEYGSPLTDKFEYAQQNEINTADEELLIRFFQPALRSVRGRLWRRLTWVSADLIVLTDRRLLWIAEQYKQAHEPYGTISRSAAIAAIDEIRYRVVDHQPHLHIQLGSGDVWRVHVNEGCAEHASSFCAAIRTALSGTAMDHCSPRL